MTTPDPDTETAIADRPIADRMALLIIDRHGGECRLEDLTEGKFSLPDSTAGQALRRLETDGLIERRSCLRDSRQTIICRV